MTRLILGYCHPVGHDCLLLTVPANEKCQLSLSADLLAGVGCVYYWLNMFATGYWIKFCFLYCTTHVMYII